MPCEMARVRHCAASALSAGCCSSSSSSGTSSEWLPAGVASPSAAAAAAAALSRWRSSALQGTDTSARVQYRSYAFALQICCLGTQYRLHAAQFAHMPGVGLWLCYTSRPEALRMSPIWKGRSLSAPAAAQQRRRRRAVLHGSAAHHVQQAQLRNRVRATGAAPVHRACSMCGHSHAGCAAQAQRQERQQGQVAVGAALQRLHG